MRRTRARLLPAAIVLAALCLLPPSASADTIYLKNGRMIHAREAKIDGERVVFTQHGSTQAIPLSLVDRIVDDDRVGPGERRPAVTPGSESPAATAGAGAPASSASPRTIPGAMDSSERLQMLSQFLGNGAADGGPVDPTQALGLLQALGGFEGGASDEANLGQLGGLLGMLGPAMGDLNSMGSDLEKAQMLLPALIQLGQTLFSPEYSAEATDAAAAELLRALAAAGVPPGRIEAEARRYGLPTDVLRRLRR